MGTFFPSRSIGIQCGEACMTRYQCTKKRLAALGFDPEKSEIEIMREQYYYRVYGAGSKRYVYTIK